MGYDVVGLGNPLIDIFLHVDDAFLKTLGLHKGSMNLVDQARQQQILAEAKDLQRTVTLGGSCANTMVMIAQLGGKVAYGGKIGDDELGAMYESQLIENGVASCLVKQKGMTGSTIILVNPDAERTMNTHLGMSQAFAETDLDAEAIRQADYLYVEGYLWDTPTQKKAVLAALEQAKTADTKIALTLSDSFCVERHQDDFRRLMAEYVDILFCNETEAGFISAKSSPEEQLKVMSETVDQIVLTLGRKGSCIHHQGTTTFIDPFPVRAIDTTGAGDSYAAGYLYGLTHHYSVLEAGTLASYCAATVVSQNGPRVQGDFRAMVAPYLIR